MPELNDHTIAKIATDIVRAQAARACGSMWPSHTAPPCHPDSPAWNGCPRCVDRPAIAASIRALADAVVPEEDLNKIGESVLPFAYQRQKDRRDVLAIADAVEAPGGFAVEPRKTALSPTASAVLKAAKESNFWRRQPGEYAASVLRALADLCGQLDTDGYPLHSGYLRQVADELAKEEFNG